MYQETTATKKVFALQKRIQGIAGGTSASKTISVLLRLIAMAQSDYDCEECGVHGCLNRDHAKKWVMKPTLTSVVSETMPHLKRGAMRDFLNIMTAHGYYKEERWNRSDFIYTCETGSKIEFFSADMPSKTRGPRRDRLFINEGNNIKYEAADQMMVRTRQLIIIDWNPTSEFWWYTEVMPNRDHDFLTVTYKDNEALDPEIVADIESHKNNKSWWRVYGEGQLGENEDMVYSGWIPISAIPHEARLVKRGLDFGYTNHPSGLVDVWYWNGAYILDEQLYQKGMSNQDIHDKIDLLPEPQKLVVADSAEPKSIDELMRLGTNIAGANKGPGSILQGIQFVQDQQIYYTKRSVHLVKEYRNYMWRRDPDGMLMNEPEDLFNHLMDAVRYALESEIQRRDKVQPINTGNAEVFIY